MSKPRRAGTLSGMLLSIAVVVTVLAALMVLWGRGDPDPVRVVDYAPAVTSARAAGALPAAVPAGLSPGWRATSVRYRALPDDPGKAVWHLGFVTPDDKYAAVEQSNEPAKAFIKAATVGGRADGQQQVGDQAWARYYSASSGHRSLARTEGTITTVVTGTLSYDDLAVFASRLRAA